MGDEKPKRERKRLLPRPVEEVGYKAGDGPLWVSAALGAEDAIESVVRFLSEDAEETALVMRFRIGYELVIRPARKVTTRWLTETVGALGFRIPYYSAGELNELGQAIGRIADKYAEEHRQEEAASAVTEYATLVGSWGLDSLCSNQAFVLVGRQGRDVRAAIEHVRRGYVHGSWTAPLIFEPERGAFLVWTVPVRNAIRDRMGTASDASIGLHLRRAGLVRERLAARAVGDRKTPIEMPVFVVPNGWQSIEVEKPADCRESGRYTLPPVVDRWGPSSHARPQGLAHTPKSEGSTTDRAEEGR